MVFAPGFIVVGDSPVNNAVSTYGIINWEQHISLLQNSIINGYGVAADTSGNVVVTGTANSNHPDVIVSTNGGLTWSATNLGHVFKTQGYGILKASSYNGLTGRVFIAYGHDNSSGGGPHLCYGTCDNSGGWIQQQVTFFGNQGYIKSMATDKSNTFVAVGYNGNGSNSIGTTHIAYSINNGANWTEVASSIFNGSGNGVAYGLVDSSNCYIAVGTNTVGNPTVYACEYNDPTTWVQKGNPFDTNANITLLSKLSYTPPTLTDTYEVTTSGYGNCVATDGISNWLIGGKSLSGTNNMYYTSDFISYTQVIGGPSVEVFSVYYNELYSGKTGEPYWFAVGNSGSTQSIYYSFDPNASSWLLSSGTQPAISRSIASGIIEVACIAKGTKISTPLGYIPVEDLHEGDVILINKGEYANIRKIFHRTVKVTPTTAPYRIPGGEGHEDLTISPTHSVFVRGQMIEAQFLGHPHDDRYTDVIEYYNISVDSDENTVMYANGVPIETYREHNYI
jgi:hypothetical protein